MQPHYFLIPSEIKSVEVSEPVTGTLYSHVTKIVVFQKIKTVRDVVAKHKNTYMYGIVVSSKLCSREARFLNF